MTDHETKKKTFWQFLAGFFREDEPESMNRVISLMSGVAAVVFGCLMYSHSKGQQVIVPWEFWLPVVFLVVGMLGKNIQKIVEKLADKYKA